MTIGGRIVSAKFADAILPHLDAAFRLARWLLRDPVAAEDVVQDALVRAMTYFDNFRGENPRAWLLQIVRNTAWTSRAGSKRLDQLDDDAHGELATADPDPEAALVQAEASQILTDAIARLPADLRECLVLREIEELPYRDIAIVVGVPIGTVMSRLFRARKLLLAGAVEILK